MSIPLNTSGYWAPVPFFTVPVGVPTGPGMFLMLGCGATVPPDRVTVPCQSMPGYKIFQWDDSGVVINAEDPSVGCYINWWPVLGGGFLPGNGVDFDTSTC